MLETIHVTVNVSMLNMILDSPLMPMEAQINAKNHNDINIAIYVMLLCIPK